MFLTVHSSLAFAVLYIGCVLSHVIDGWQSVFRGWQEVLWITVSIGFIYLLHIIFFASSMDGLDKLADHTAESAFCHELKSGVYGIRG